MFIMFLAVNTTLLITRATDRLWQITMLDDGSMTSSEMFGLAYDLDNPQRYLRAEACGQIASATMNFVLAILLGMAGTAESDYADADTQRPEAS